MPSTIDSDATTETTSDPTPIGLDRRRFLQVFSAVGVGVVALPWLAACGSSSKGSASSSGASSTGAASGGSSSSAGAAPDIAKVKALLGFDKLDAKTLGAGKSISMTAQLALTGTIAFYGGVMTNGLKLAINHIKAMGGPDIQMTYQDNKGGDAQASISGAREIISNGQQFMISSIGGSLGAILPVIATANIVCINTGSAYAVPPYVSAKNYWETDGNLNLIDPFIGEYLANVYPGKSKLFMILPDTGAASNAANEANVKAALKDPWKVVSTQYVLLGSSDFSGIISKISSANPDVCYTPLASGAFGQFVKAYRGSGGTAPILTSGAPPSTDDFAAAGSQIAGVVFCGGTFNVNHPDNPWGDLFLADYYSAYGKKPGLPDYYATNYYVNLFTWWQLWQVDWAKGNDPTAASVNATLQASPTLKTIYGGDANSVGTTKIDGTTHFADMLIGAYELQKDQTYKQVGRTNADGTGYVKV
jgi:branched-chain amino acid transport system substrate-binding protein